MAGTKKKAPARKRVDPDRTSAEMQAQDDADNSAMCSCIHRRDHHVDWGHTGACQWDTCTCKAFAPLLGGGR